MSVCVDCLRVIDDCACDNGKDAIQIRFEKFHAKNPEVYVHLLRLAREAQGRGFQRIGIETLWQVVRWEIWLKTSDTKFKLNDHYRSRYARKLMQDHPELEGLFELRQLASEKP